MSYNFFHSHNSMFDDDDFSFDRIAEQHAQHFNSIRNNFFNSGFPFNPMTPPHLGPFFGNSSSHNSFFNSNPFQFNPIMPPQFGNFGDSHTQPFNNNNISTNRSTDRQIQNFTQNRYEQNNSGLKISVNETDVEMKIRAEIPGVSPEDVKIDINDYVLHLSGKIAKVEQYQENQVTISQRSYGTFTRFIQLPKESDIENMTTKFKDGVLKITIPKISSQTCLIEILE
ncbi:HSP20-like chaperone [Conidiobolus coronatus NRRL 28638]|uniref:HSP20-like chaperone n=1 Tax=Conidiobolus coronatus (strain ATCC 28846 / CBS 209.66 / NRRL 28638) TaxID=796925 RepID=A0A137PGE0_CONC2|nr:HSP20-like chaperone [Conidiobolus coronatus NRRL 28638]|eukprot:KXN74040.1 HSP20-like chaperone [Conidiobolus coronatus NRRL 28638]